MIAKIRVHPTNPDLVYVAAFGHHAAPNPDRGVYRSKDGGKTWEKILFRDNKTGANELVLDPKNPQVIYAALWEAYRNAFEMSSGGPGSGIFKSTDGGDHWTEISRNPGLPKAMLGKIGFSVSGADSNRLYAQIEAEDGGFFSSDDAGATWKKVNERRDLRQRAFYYSRVYADPKVKDTVWVLNVNIYKSTDAGKTWKASNVPHGDNHDMWIASTDSNRMIEANDGGGTISINGGDTWTAEPMPTAQFYHVITTKHVPYHVCGAQQDNSTACVSSVPPQGGPGGSGGGADQVFYSVGGGESGYIASDPRNPDIFYAGSYGGLITRQDKRTGQERQVNPYPDNPMGYASADIAERFQWTFPIVMAPTDPRIIYVGSQHVWKSTNEGQSWEKISPDLTRHDPKTMGPSGGPLTKDNTGVETYATVFTHRAVGEGRGGHLGRLRRRLRAGDAQRRHQLEERDAEGAGRLRAHQPDRGVAVPRRHRLRRGQPLSAGRLQAVRLPHRRLRRELDRDHRRHRRRPTSRAPFARTSSSRSCCISAPSTASTSRSTTAAKWESLRQNLPDTPVHDIAVEERDLVIATHGRGFYVMDHIAPLRQGGLQTTTQLPSLQAGRRAARPRSQRRDRLLPEAARAEGQDGVPRPGGQGHPHLHRHAGRRRAQAAGAGRLDRRWAAASAGTASGGRGRPAARSPGTCAIPGATDFPGLIMWAASSRGPLAAPGSYQVRLTVDGQTETQPFAVRREPHLLKDVTDQDLREEFDLAIKVRDKASQANEAVLLVRGIKAQIEERKSKLDAKSAAVAKALDEFAAALSAIEGEIYQVKLQSSQDPLNFPIKLNNKIAALQGVIESADVRPTEQAYSVFRTLSNGSTSSSGKLDTRREGRRCRRSTSCCNG